MPFLLIAVGLVLIVTGVRDTHAQLGAQLTKDFTGQQNFTVWILAIGSVGALGYIENLRTFSHYFLALIIIAMVLSNRGFFQKFTEQFAAGPLASSTPAGVTPSTNQSDAAKPTLTITAPTASGSWWDVFKGGPLDFLKSR